MKVLLLLNKVYIFMIIKSIKNKEMKKIRFE